MDKLKRVLNGNDDTSNEENRGIMGDVGVHFLLLHESRLKFNEILLLNKYIQLDEFDNIFHLD